MRIIKYFFSKLWHPFTYKKPKKQQLWNEFMVENVNLRPFGNLYERFLFNSPHLLFGGVLCYWLWRGYCPIKGNKELFYVSLVITLVSSLEDNWQLRILYQLDWPLWLPKTSRGSRGRCRPTSFQTPLLILGQFPAEIIIRLSVRNLKYEHF